MLFAYSRKHKSIHTLSFLSFPILLKRVVVSGDFYTCFLSKLTAATVCNANVFEVFGAFYMIVPLENPDEIENAKGKLEEKG